MKKAIWLATGLLMLMMLFCGCNTEGNNMESAKTGTVTVISGLTDADMWILPDTEANRKTSLWGTATAAQVKTGESRPVSLCEPGDGGRYLLRVIDADEFYYSADGVVLQDGWTVTITETDLMSAAAEVADENGVLQHTYDVFMARL